MIVRRMNRMVWRFVLLAFWFAQRCVYLCHLLERYHAYTDVGHFQRFVKREYYCEALGVELGATVIFHEGHPAQIRLR